MIGYTNAGEHAICSNLSSDTQSKSPSGKSDPCYCRAFSLFPIESKDQKIFLRVCLKETKSFVTYRKQKVHPRQDCSV